MASGIQFYSFKVPHFVQSDPSDSLVKDVLPLVTMAATVPTIYLFYKAGRWVDSFLFFMGAAIAVIYHSLTIMPGGLDENELWGINGLQWRTIDILVCVGLIQRSFVDLLGARSLIVGAIIPNAIFPAMALRVVSRPGATEDDVGRVFHMCNLAAAVLKCLLEGLTFPRFDLAALGRSLVSMVLGFTFFFLCEAYPDMYYLYHSLWHVFMSHGYFIVYSEGKLDVAEVWSRIRGRGAGKGSSKGGARGGSSTSGGGGGGGAVEGPTVGVMTLTPPLGRVAAGSERVVTRAAARKALEGGGGVRGGRASVEGWATSLLNTSLNLTNQALGAAEVPE